MTSHPPSSARSSGSSPSTDATNPPTQGALRYNGAPGRRQRIITSLRASGFLSVAELARELAVSDMTVRRDLRRLAELGEVRMVHGGASLPHGTLQTPGFIARAGERAEPKRRIARQAAASIEATEAIAVDAGTTAYELAVALPEAYAGMVVTHSVPVISHLLHRPEVTVVGLGGELHPPSQAFVGSMTVEAARRLRVRTAFMAAAAVDPDGVYVHADAERETKLALMDIAETVVLLAGREKFRRAGPMLLCGLERIDNLITDAPPTEALAQRLDAQGVTVT
ncbi:MAG: DeoR/GlpR family DNA-binding transcription regulator, partial [Micromonosporaceae bacterium]